MNIPTTGPATASPAATGSSSAQGRPDRLSRSGILQRRALARGRSAIKPAVRTLRARQFTEDAGPLAHPVRPREYREESTTSNNGDRLREGRRDHPHAQDPARRRRLRPRHGSVFRAPRQRGHPRSRLSLPVLREPRGSGPKTHFALWYEQGRHAACRRLEPLRFRQAAIPPRFRAIDPVHTRPADEGSRWSSPSRSASSIMMAGGARSPGGRPERTASSCCVIPVTA